MLVTLNRLSGIQLGWMLRPVVGDSHAPTAFLRTDRLTNSYIALFEIICRAMKL